MIPELQQIFHSITKSLEIFYVLEGRKPCARILVFEDELGMVLDFLKESKLNCSVSDFRVAKQESSFYSDKSLKLGKNSRQKGCFIVYVSKDGTCNDAKNFENEGDHLRLGLVLGYPKCCCSFFAEKFSAGNADLTLDVLEDSDGFEFSFFTNIAARHFDASLLSHFPCSFGCRPSVEIAKGNLKSIKNSFPELSSIFERMLRSVVIYTKNDGVFLLINYQNTAGEIIYQDVMATEKSKMYYLLSSNKKLEIMGKNNFVINGEKIGGKYFGVMVFV